METKFDRLVIVVLIASSAALLYVLRPYGLLFFDEGFSVYPAEFYDLSTDPGERSNLAATHPQVVSKMQATLEQYVGQASTSAVKTTLEVPPEVQGNLRALGYISEDE